MAHVSAPYALANDHREKCSWQLERPDKQGLLQLGILLIVDLLLKIFGIEDSVFQVYGLRLFRPLLDGRLSKVLFGLPCYSPP